MMFSFKTIFNKTCAALLTTGISLSVLPMVCSAQTDLGIVTATGINNSTQVVGYYIQPPNPTTNLTHAFLWQSGSLTDLGTLTPDPNHPGKYLGESRAQGINNKGQICGFCGNPNTGPIQAFVRLLTVMTTLTGIPNARRSAAFAINDFAQVTGSCEFLLVNGHGSYISHPFLWDNGTLTDIGTLVANPPPPAMNLSTGVGNAINASAQIAGSAGSDIGNQVGDAFYWANAPMINLSTFGGRDSWARGINYLPEVVGGAQGSNFNYHAFSWKPGGSLVDLGTLNPTNPTSTSDAYSINKNGLIVGTSNNHACSWIGTTITDLNTTATLAAGWVLNVAVSVNDNGRIVGTGTLNGVAHSFLL